MNSYPEIKKWKNGHWNFNFTKWFEDAQTHEIKENPQYIPAESLLDDLEMTHVILLREQMIDSRRKQVELMADIRKSDQYSEDEKALFGKDKQRQVSRNFEFLNNEKIISGHQLLYDCVKFGIFNQIAFYGEMSSEMKKSESMPFNQMSTDYPSDHNSAFSRKNIFGGSIYPQSTRHRQ